MPDTEDAAPLSFSCLIADPTYLTLVKQQCLETLDGHAELLLDDATQATWMKIQQAIQSGHKIQHLAGWLRTVAHNTSIDLLRRNRDSFQHSADDNDIPDQTASFSSLEAKIDFQRIYHLVLTVLPMDEIGQRRRNIFRYVVEGRSQTAVAQLLQISNSLVTKDLYYIQKLVVDLEIAWKQFAPNLTESQRKILHLAIEGKRYHDVAKLLGLSTHYVKKELQAIITQN